MSDLFNTASRIVQDAVDSPLTVMRKLGFYIPSKSDISTGVTEIAEGFSRGSDAKEMTTGSQEFSEGNYLSGGTKMLGGLAGMAIPFSNKIRSAGKAVGKNIDDQLLNMKYTRETPKTKGGFSSVDLAAQGKITDKEAIGGMFNPISFGKDGMKVGKDASNLNTSRIEISTFDPASTPSSLGFGMKTADDIGLPASQVGTKTKDAIKVQTNLIEGSKWKWEGKVPEGFENNTHLVSMQGGSKLKKASGGPTDHSYATKVIYEKGGNLSTYDTRAEYVKELYKSVPESMAALKIKMPKEVKKVTKELKAEGKSTEEIKKKVDSLKKKLNRDYKGDNPKGKPTTVGVPEFGKKIGDIKKGGIIQPVYDQIIMREAGGQVLPMQYGGGLDDAYMNRSSAFAAPDANSAFDRPIDRMPMPSSGGLDDAYMSLSQRRNALPMMSREQGGGLKSIPRERMIGDQPHQLSYINEEEAGLLKALGGSGRKVDGIPAYDEGTGWDGAWDDAGGYTFSGGSPGDPGDTTSGDDITQADVDAAQAAAAQATADAASQAQDDAMYNATWGLTGPGPSFNTEGGYNYPAGTGPSDTYSLDYNFNGRQGNESPWDHVVRSLGPRPASVFFTNLKGKGFTNEQAAASLSATISKGGGPSLSSGYNDGYSFGGPGGTLGGINDEYRAADQRSFRAAMAKQADLEKDQEQRDQEGMLEGYTPDSRTLSSLTNFFSTNLNPGTPSNLDEAFGPGGTHQPGNLANPYGAEQWAQSRGGTYQAQSDMDKAFGKAAPTLAGMSKFAQSLLSGIMSLTDTTPMGAFTDQYGETFNVDVGGNITSRGVAGWDGYTAPELEPTPTPITAGPPTVTSDNVPTVTYNAPPVTYNAPPVSDPTASSGSQNLPGQSPATTMGSTQSPSSVPGSSQDPNFNDGDGEGEEKPLNNSEIPSYGLNTRVATSPAANIFSSQDAGEDSEATTGLSAMQKTLGPQVRTLINAGYSAEDAIRYLGISNSSLTTAEILKELNLG